MALVKLDFGAGRGWRAADRRSGAKPEPSGEPADMNSMRKLSRERSRARPGAAERPPLLRPEVLRWATKRPDAAHDRGAAQRNGIRTKQRQLANGRVIGGSAFGVGGLAHLRVSGA
jgi:hypothetical protein